MNIRKMTFAALAVMGVLYVGFLYILSDMYNALNSTWGIILMSAGAVSLGLWWFYKKINEE